MMYYYISLFQFDGFKKNQVIDIFQSCNLFYHLCIIYVTRIEYSFVSKLSNLFRVLLALIKLYGAYSTDQTQPN